MPTKLPGTAAAGRVLGAQRRANPQGQMPLMEHVRELRARLLKALLGIGVGMIAGFVWFYPVWHFIEGPFCRAEIRGQTGCHKLGDQLVINGIFDPFMLRVKVAFIVALIITSPIWLYQLWAFIAPGLYSREKKWTFAFVGSAVPLFVLGGGFAYLAMSRGLKFLLGLTPSGITNLPTIDTYLSYVLAMLLIFGLAFELPLAMVMLNMAGILTHARFKRYRRVMIFGVFAFAAVATPSPDPFTMMMLALPCAVLIEVAEVVVWANDRRRARMPQPYAGLADDEASPLELDDSIRTPDPD